MNPYAKIAIKVGVVIAICLILLVAYDMVGHKAYMAAAKAIQAEKANQQNVSAQLDSLLQYQPLLPAIRCVQLGDLETIRVLCPEAKQFGLTGYLRQIHSMLSENHLETDGIVIAGTAAAVGGVTFEEAFKSDVTALQSQLDKIKAALQMFQDNADKMNNLLASFQFYQALASGTENFEAIIGGIEQHKFTLSVRGSYTDIKKFTFDVFNMRPHTALVNFQMSPQGPGLGPTRLYSASFTLLTYGDANPPPPLWEAYHGRGEQASEASAETQEADEGEETREKTGGESSAPEGRERTANKPESGGSDN